MKLVDALTKSQHTRLVARVKDDGMFMFCDGDSNTYWTETESGKVKKYGGNPGNYDDWEIVKNGTEPYTVFKTKIARDPKQFIKEPWEVAVALSPISVCYRTKQHDGALMVRFSDGSTFTEIGQSFVRIDEKQFRSYDGWHPIVQDHALWPLISPYAGRNPQNIKRIEKPGTNMPAKPAPVKRGYMPVDTATIQTAGMIATSLAEVFRSMVEAEGRVSKEAIPIRDSLLQLSKNVSWLMNEGRGAWLKDMPDEHPTRPSEPGTALEAASDQ